PPTRPLFLRRSFFFSFQEPARPEFFALSLRDALPIFLGNRLVIRGAIRRGVVGNAVRGRLRRFGRLFDRPLQLLVPFRHSPSARSEEHTSELQSRENLVCRLLLEKKNPQNEKPSV